MTPNSVKSTDESRATWQSDPFAEPQTIPAGWDMSDITHEKLSQQDWSWRYTEKSEDDE